ncbi:hypothetical protein M413DRAFT_449769 [Hebeloma cylindrosporum]|uniref:Uncharacterized protein n=1 Tax=Hebeloma cylindrosporum TaxID=76867 RepID=A0A0C2Y2Q5_HEBCY|nr:hypothetical protein M413DRAFT_449769 [Hebeloma cylindrosporum h7]
MRALSKLFSTCTATAYIVLAFLSLQVSANYFIITSPAAQSQWQNNAANLVSWEKGVLDDIYGFDVEMARMSKDGLTLVARNVPATQKRLNIFLQDVPAGDDYFLIFINSTHGVMHATSSKFTILASSASPSSTPPSPAEGIPTVTVSGSPNPTQLFATTFPAIASGALRSVLESAQVNALIVTLFGIGFGAVWTIGL